LFANQNTFVGRRYLPAEKAKVQEKCPTGKGGKGKQDEKLLALSEKFRAHENSRELKGNGRGNRERCEKYARPPKEQIT